MCANTNRATIWVHVCTYIKVVLPILPNGRDVSEDWFYGFLNQDGIEQMGGLAAVFLSSHHKQKNNRTAGLWIDSVINPINHWTVDGFHIWDNSSDFLPLFLICSHTHTNIHTQVHAQTHVQTWKMGIVANLLYNSMTLHLGHQRSLICFIFLHLHTGSEGLF